VPENVYMENMDLLGNVFVDTIDTIRCRIFLEFSSLAHKNVIVFGPRGCGKTKLLQDFVQDFGELYEFLTLRNWQNLFQLRKL
jgi:dynein heavy chain